MSDYVKKMKFCILMYCIYFDFVAYCIQLDGCVEKFKELCMSRPKMKNSHARTFRIRDEVDEKLEAYSKATMIPKTSIVEKAIEEYVDMKIVAESSGSEGETS